MMQEFAPALSSTLTTDDHIYNNEEVNNNPEQENNNFNNLHAAPSLMSIRSCLVPSNNMPVQNIYQNLSRGGILLTQSQPQLSHSFSQPFLNAMPTAVILNNVQMSSSADKLSFHEQVKNSAHKLPVVVNRKYHFKSSSKDSEDQVFRACFLLKGK